MNVICPTCNQILKATGIPLGTKVNCSTCRNNFVISEYVESGSVAVNVVATKKIKSYSVENLSSNTKRNRKKEISTIICGVILIIIVAVFLFPTLIIGAYLLNILFSIVMIPVILYIWSLVGSTIGMGVIGLVIPSYADKLIKSMSIDFPDCIKSPGYWISLVTSIAYVAIAMILCKDENIGKATGEEKFFWLIKCAIFYALPFLGLCRMGRTTDRN